jgi:ABC-type multidrug transport system ATPase subunit
MELGQTTEEAIEAEVERRLKDIEFTSKEDADKPVKTYSGGMKRKVSIAISLLGDPDVVFLDEPTAGMDPYNRRLIWDLIIKAKRGRSIILCSHHLEEVDLLSDRVAILKKGKIITCGSTLFLKHHFGVGYSLRFEAPHPVDVSCLVKSAMNVPVLDQPRTYQWNLKHGSEPDFPMVLNHLNQEGATGVSLELTTLEQVFLATGKEETSTETDVEDVYEGNGNALDGDRNINMDDPSIKREFLRKVWEQRGTVTTLSFWQKFDLVQKFMLLNAWRIKEAVTLNIVTPLLYLVGGMVMIYLIGEPDEVSRVVPEPILIVPGLAGLEATQFFGVGDEFATAMAPVVPMEDPISLHDYFGSGLSVLGGYFAQNSTLQYNAEASEYALQVGAQILANFSYLSNGAPEGIKTHLVQLPYDSEDPFRIDFLVLPMSIIYGFSGLVMSVLDVLALKGNHSVELFRVAGINEFTTSMGLMYYKVKTTFAPFFFLLVILGISLQSVLFGNGGRWLATLLTLLLYAYSAAPLGLIVGKRFIKGDFDSVKNWFPAVYMTFVSLPYIAWNLALQSSPNSRDSLLLLGDIFCIIPPFAIQRGMGAIIEVSPYFDKDDLTWGDVWKFETRVALVLVLMFSVGTLEFWYLHRLVTARPGTTVLTMEEQHDVAPDTDPVDPDIAEERNRSWAATDGIRSRDLVKVFALDIDAQESSSSTPQKRTLKQAVKGVSFGIKKNEIYVLLGPNGNNLRFAHFVDKFCVLC